MSESNQEIISDVLRNPQPISPLSQDDQDRGQRRELQKSIQWKVFITLWAQLGTLFVLMLLQGFRFQGFVLNDWAFGILVNGTLIETFFLVRFIVSHLFPTTTR